MIGNPKDTRGPRVDPGIIEQHREVDICAILRDMAEEVILDQMVTRDHTAMEAGLEANREAEIPKAAMGVEKSQQRDPKAIWRRK